MTLVASRSDVLLKAILAVELSVLLDEADVLQRTPARRIRTNEVVGAPDAAQSRYEWTSAYETLQLG